MVTSAEQASAIETLHADGNEDIAELEVKTMTHKKEQIR